MPATRRLVRNLDPENPGDLDSENHGTVPTQLHSKQIAILLLLSVAAVFIHGYHPYIEDAEIYVPGIEQVLNPALFPQNSQFFASHARLTLFPNLIAGSVRLTHLPLEWALFFWHLLSIFLLLLGCWHIGRLCFRGARAPWGGVAMVAAVLTIPIAGTALYIMDQYLNTRSLSTPAVLFIVVNILERNFLRAALWAVFTAAIHPLMAVFGLVFAAMLLWMGRRSAHQTRPSVAFWLLPFALFPPITDAYREVLQSHSYFFLMRWEWYEWIGVFAPLGLLWWFHRIARRQAMPVLDLLCRALIAFETVFFILALLSTPQRLANLAELQPMRCLQLLYVLLFVFAGGLLAEFVLRGYVWRWLLLFAPLCVGMCFVQRQLFPATSHIEWPGTAPKNAWVEAFVWVRQNTPIDAYFALDPNYMQAPGEDQHGFRAIAERSRLADRVKDSGAVSMFPALAETWRQQVRALASWKSFQAEDFAKLNKEFGVSWVVLESPGVPGLGCPYHNRTVQVCRIE